MECKRSGSTRIRSGGQNKKYQLYKRGIALRAMPRQKIFTQKSYRDSS